MRTTKRFTPDVLDRFRTLGRGTGTHENYVSWHRVSRSDPASLGRSHLLMWLKRQRELLSDLEWVGFLFSTMLKNIEDSREQYPHFLEFAAHELSLYDAKFAGTSYPGTIELARKLGIKHPKTSGNGRTESWVMSTDLVLTFRRTNHHRQLLAVAFKYPDDCKKKRTKELLTLERAYWQARGAEWLLITPDQFDERVALTLRNTFGWALGDVVTDRDMEIAADVVHRWYGSSLTHILRCLTQNLDCEETGCSDRAQRAFWQAVWCGRLPLDLRRGWRPHIPIQLLPADAFWSLNPIEARRSAWI